MDKRYQVFVSSTYADLHEERQHVIQTLMEMDCIPAGMELFPAADEEQFNFIKKVIDDCDYYLLIIGSRYGSVDDNGVSYTEKEFDYAVEKNLNVIAFVHNDIKAIENTGEDKSHQTKLLNFRKKACHDRVVKEWKSPDELPGKVAVSLQRAIKTYPAIGWVRADKVASNEALNDLNKVRKENEQLRSKIADLQDKPEPVIENLAGLDESITLHVHSQWYYNHDFERELRKTDWDIDISWRELYAIVSPDLIKTPNELKVNRCIADALAERKSRNYHTNKLHDQDFQTIGVQFVALGLVKIEQRPTTNGGVGTFWELTKAGKQLMYELRTVRSQADS